MRIHSKLLLNSTITVFCLILIGGIGLFFTHNVAHISMSMVETEALPIATIDELKNSVWEIWLKLIVHTSVSDVETMQQLEKEISVLENKITLQINILEKKYLTHFENKSDHLKNLQLFEEHWQKFQQLADKVLQLSQDFTKEDALNLILQKEHEDYEQVIESLRSLITQHQTNMSILRNQAMNARENAMTAIITLTLLISLIALWLINRFGHSLIQPLFAVSNQLKSLSLGQLAEEVIVYHGQDEMSELINSTQQLNENMKMIICQANAIAEGNYNNEINLLSNSDRLGLALTNMTYTLQNVITQARAIAEGDYSREVKILSEQDQLGKALLDMVHTLRQVTDRNNEQNWLKSGLTQLHERLRGEQEIQLLAKNTIDFLTTYLKVSVGLFYLLQNEQKPYLQFVASYAYTTSNTTIDKFFVGEGLVGQAALEGKPIIQALSDDVYSHIVQSNLSKVAPRYVILLPFSYEKQVKGVIELGCYHTLTDIQHELLEQAMPNIGIAINGAESRVKMKVLLEQSQCQAKELQVQQEELQTTNEELQTQQEELRQANEELEIRSRDLERQKNEVRSKNSVLEQTQKEIQTKAKELELASKYKSEFLANMSHELRTPLNSLLVLAQLLTENKAKNLTDKQVEYAQTIHSAGSDLLILINEILDLSKIESGKVEMNHEDIFLTPLVSSTKQKFQPLADQKQLQFTLQLADDVANTKLHTDEQRLKQIINNLLSNAFKFTAKGEIKLNIQLVDKNICQKFKVSQCLAISVSDTGIGIPEDKQKVIFEAFQQVDGTTNRRYGGTGLGLSISRQLARLLGGDLVVQSVENKGSTFTLYLPYVTAATAPIKKIVQPLELPNNISLKSEVIALTPTISIYPDDRGNLQENDKVIAIIEDDHNFLNILIELTHDKGFKCIAADDGKLGLQLIEEYLPDAIILDVKLPSTDGLTVMEKLKDNPATRHIPVHFISGQEQDNQVKKMGAIGFLLKPTNTSELADAFKKIEQFITTDLKQLLVICDNEMRCQQIINLAGGDNIQATVAISKLITLQTLKRQSFDCIILDVDCEKGTTIQLLDQLRTEIEVPQTPVILYAERELTDSELAILHRCEDSLPIKAVQSPERLLDETTLFLHQIEARLPKEKRNLLNMVHDKEAIFRGKKVLLVDDDVRNSFALMTYLDGKEIEVIVANNGKEALIMLEEHADINIVLMDIMMPEMDGYEAMQHIRKQPKYRKLPIIALTAKAMKGDKAKCIEAGASDYLAKPVSTEKLLSLMRVWLYQ